MNDPLVRPAHRSVVVCLHQLADAPRPGYSSAFGRHRHHEHLRGRGRCLHVARVRAAGRGIAGQPAGRRAGGRRWHHGSAKQDHDGAVRERPLPAVLGLPRVRRRPDPVRVERRHPLAYRVPRLDEGAQRRRTRALLAPALRRLPCEVEPDRFERRIGEPHGEPAAAGLLRDGMSECVAPSDSERLASKPLARERQRERHRTGRALIDAHVRRAVGDAAAVGECVPNVAVLLRLRAQVGVHDVPHPLRVGRREQVGGEPLRGVLLPPAALPERGQGRLVPTGGGLLEERPPRRQRVRRPRAGPCLCPTPALCLPIGRPLGAELS